MKNTKPPFTINKKSHFMKPGAVAFIPGWIMLFILVLTLAIFFPDFFGKSLNNYPFSIGLLAFILGSLMPAFDDLFGFVFGPPFAHHSLFHSFAGLFVTYIIFLVIGDQSIAQYALYGNATHIIFNYYLDYTTLFFPFTYREFGLTHIIKIHTYWIKAINYPIILLAFALALLKIFSTL